MCAYLPVLFGSVCLGLGESLGNWGLCVTSPRHCRLRRTADSDAEGLVALRAPVCVLMRKEETKEERRHNRETRRQGGEIRTEGEKRIPESNERERERERERKSERVK